VGHVADGRSKMKKVALVIHSGGMDSSLCLALAMQEHGASNILSVSFQYDQRHQTELAKAAFICKTWGVDHVVIPLNCLKQITSNALINSSIPIETVEGNAPNTLVVGRNGLMARLGAIHADSLGAKKIYMGIIGVEGNYSGYRDCSRSYMDLVEKTLRLDLDDPTFEIVTPLVEMTKAETMELGERLGVLDFLLEHTVTCYEGVVGEGCHKCPACKLRAQGLEEYRTKKYLRQNC
jgi:7-cyano-7-deazaguanine synthase